MRTPLHHAVEGGSNDIVKLLLGYPLIDPNKVDILHRTPLHVGMQTFSFSLLSLFEQKTYQSFL